MSSKSPSDSVGTMINMILIEIGKALRPLDKGGGKTFAAANPRLRTTLPMAIDIFHQSLDEMECEIVRAKAVLERDLEHVRSQHVATLRPDDAEIASIKDSVPQKSHLVPSLKPSVVSPTGVKQQSDPAGEPRVALVGSAEERAHPAIVLAVTSPNRSSSIATSNVVGSAVSLDTLSTTNVATQDSLDSLLRISAGGVEQTKNPVDASNLSTHFQDVMASQENIVKSGESALWTPTKPTLSNADDDAVNEADTLEDPLAFSKNPVRNDSIDMDLAMPFNDAEDSVFDDVFFGGEDGTDGTAELEHGQFDNAYFGLDE